MIKIENVIKNYKVGETQVHACNGVRLEIPDGAFVSVSGRSGSGKTTLLNLIAGKEKPDSGKVLIDGVDIHKLPDKQLSKFRNENIGFVFQSFLLEPSMTALENVELPLIIRKYSKEKRHEIAKDMLEKVGLGERLYHKPGQLSGGERQRVSIARALCTNPKILVADEPTGNLDAKTGEDIMALIRSLTKDCTFVLVTHDEELARSAPIRIVMRDGKIISKNG
ncbi:MAG: ABC transporter ATP-binding protein [Clostridiales bacterium]|nr:ABC transporter ATP-binding protein [Clostridiales bacterium]MBR5057209.1 ABC transporter ATP-binding protein [Clostridiales bacterium]